MLYIVHGMQNWNTKLISVVFLGTSLLLKEYMNKWRHETFCQMGSSSAVWMVTLLFSIVKIDHWDTSLY